MLNRHKALELDTITYSVTISEREETSHPIKALELLEERLVSDGMFPSYISYFELAKQPDNALELLDVKHLKCLVPGAFPYSMPSVHARTPWN